MAGKYLYKEQNWLRGTTTYWFKFNDETVGIVQQSTDVFVVDENENFLEENEPETIAIRENCIIDEEMEME